MLEALHRLADKSVPMEVVQAESLAKMRAHREAKLTRPQ